MAPTIEYYFSFASPWSYIGSRRFQRLVHDNGAQVVFKPVDVMHIFSVSGGVPVKQRSQQRQAYRLLEMERWRVVRDIPIVSHPKFFPVDPSLAHRVLLAAIEELGHDHASVHEYAHKGLEAVWTRDLNIADENIVALLANEAGLDGIRLLERAKGETGWAAQETALTQEAEDRQVFGVPTYLYQGEPFWGQDRLEMLDEAIRSGREATVVL